MTKTFNVSTPNENHDRCKSHESMPFTKYLIYL